jgi:hypothetical protein
MGKDISGVGILSRTNSTSASDDLGSLSSKD